MTEDEIFEKFKKRMRDETAKALLKSSKDEQMELLCNKFFEVWEEFMEAGRLEPHQNSRGDENA